MVSRVLLSSLLLLSVARLCGQVSITTLGIPYNQNFNMLASSGSSNSWTNNSTIPGWYLFRQPAPGTALTSYAASNGSSMTGSMYSFGATSDPERALGALASGAAYWGSPGSGAVAGWIAVAFQNNTGTTITQVQMTYNGEQWRDANTSVQSLVVEYGIGASFTTVPAWTAAGASFDFNSPVNSNSGAIDGNTTGKLVGLGGLIGSLTWNPGDILWIRWRVTNAAGSDHGLGIDDFQFIAYSPDYDITVSGGSMTVTDLKGNSDVLIAWEPSVGNIGFNVPGRTYSLNGGAATPFPVTLSLTGITDLTINAEDGNDAVDIQGPYTIPFPSLTINGGNDDDDVLLSGNITFSTGAFLNLNLSDDTSTPGIDNVFFTSGCVFTLDGNDAIIDVSRSVAFSPGSALVINSDGDIYVNANYPSSFTSGSFTGIILQNATIQNNSYLRTIYLNGRGGDGPGGQHGIALYNASQVLASDGFIYMSGYGGDGSDSFNMGVTLESNSVVSGYSIQISGYGGGQYPTAFNWGFHTYDSPSIIGNFVNIYGQGGTGASGDQNHGIIIRDTAIAHGYDYLNIYGEGGGVDTSEFSTGVLIEEDAQIKGNTVNINGTGGPSDGDFNRGVLIRLSADVLADYLLINGYGGNGQGSAHVGFNTATGATVHSNLYMSIYGQGGNSLTLGQGVRVAFNSDISSDGNIYIQGQGGYNPLGTEGYGVFLRDNGSSITALGGVTIVGVEGAGGDHFGIVMQDSTTVASTGGHVELVANSMVLNSPAAISGNTYTLLQNLFFLVPIDIGATTDVLSGPLSLSDAELDLITTPLLYVGTPWNTGDISISAPITTVGKDVELRSAEDIIFLTTGGTFDVSTAHDLTLSSGFPPNGIYPDLNGVDVSTAPTTLTLSPFSTLYITVNGVTPGDGTGSTYTQLTVNGGINIGANVNLEIIGSYVPTGGETFIIGVNDGTDAVTGIFNGLPEGGTIINILGSGLNATITYMGDTGNDIVITVDNSSCSPPTFTVCPSPIVVSNTLGQCGAVVSYTATATGTPPPTLSYTFSGATTGSGAGTGSGSFFNVGTTNVVITATNGCPPDATCSFSVTVNDIEAPTITCPATQTLMLDASCQATLPAYSPASVSDNCGSPTVTQTPAAGTTVSGPGAMTVTLTATDGSGNTATCTFTVNKVDNTAPTITCPATQTLMLDASCQATLPAYSPASVSDNCGSPTVTQTPAAGTTVSGPGAMTVTLTAADGSGNTTTCTFTMNKVDNTPPSVVCPASFTVNVDPDCELFIINYTDLATKSDNCASSVSISQSPMPETVVSGTGITVITFTASDGNGNTSTCTFTIVRADNTAPSITCPPTQTLVLDASCQATLPAYSPVSVSDNCGSPTVTQTPTAGTTVSGAGPMTVTLTAADGSGNTATCTFTVNKVDNTPPSITCPLTQTLPLNASCQATLPAYSPASVSDNCGSPTVTQTPAAGTTVSGPGAMTVTLTATDGSGNTASCAFTVVKTGSSSCGGGTDFDGDGYFSPEDCDDTDPSVYPGAPELCDGKDNNCNGLIDEGFPPLVITCPSSVPALTADARCRAAIPDYTSLATVSGGCSAPFNPVVQMPAPGTIFNPGRVAIKLTGSNAAGQTASCTFHVTILGGCH